MKEVVFSFSVSVAYGLIVSKIFVCRNILLCRDVM
jgi:hypothetical protein